MSTAPTVLPVDAPPPVPALASYPLSFLQYPGYQIFTAQPWDPTKTASEQFDPNSEMQIWQRPQQAGENGETYKLWNCIVNGVEIPNGIALTIDQASKANVAPSGMPQSVFESLATSAYYSQPSVPIPVRPLIATESIVATANGFQVVNSAVVAPPTPQTAQQATDSANIAECLKILRSAYPNLA